MKYFPLIWYGIWRKRSRSLLIFFQILVAFLLFGLLQGTISGINQALDNMRADLFYVLRSEGNFPLPIALLQRILSVPGVKKVNVENYFRATYQTPKQQVLVMASNIDGSWSDFHDQFTTNTEALQAMGRVKTGVLVSAKLVEKYGWKVGDRIPLQSQIRQQDGSTTWTFDVVGVFNDKDTENTVIINNEYFDEARAEQRGSVQRYLLTVNDAKQGMTVALNVDNLFTNSADETRTESVREYAQSQMQSVGDMKFVVRSIVGAVMFALLFSTGAMMMQSLHERTPELAVLKTLGFGDIKILVMILVESLILCMLAAGGGLALAALVLPSAATFLRLDLALSMQTSVLIVGSALAVALAALGSALPAWRGLRLQVVDALAGR